MPRVVALLLLCLFAFVCSERLDFQSTVILGVNSAEESYQIQRDNFLQLYDLEYTMLQSGDICVAYISDQNRWRENPPIVHLCGHRNCFNDLHIEHLPSKKLQTDDPLCAQNSDTSISVVNMNLTCTTAGLSLESSQDVHIENSEITSGLTGIIAQNVEITSSTINSGAFLISCRFGCFLG